MGGKEEAVTRRTLVELFAATRRHIARFEGGNAAEQRTRGAGEVDTYARL
jgi:hypothetical protein